MAINEMETIPAPEGFGIQPAPTSVTAQAPTTQVVQQPVAEPEPINSVIDDLDAALAGTEEPEPVAEVNMAEAKQEIQEVLASVQPVVEVEQPQEGRIHLTAVKRMVGQENVIKEEPVPTEQVQGQAEPMAEKEDQDAEALVYDAMQMDKLEQNACHEDAGFCDRTVSAGHPSMAVAQDAGRTALDTFAESEEVTSEDISEEDTDAVEPTPVKSTKRINDNRVDLQLTNDRMVVGKFTLREFSDFLSKDHDPITVLGTHLKVNLRHLDRFGDLIIHEEGGKRSNGTGFAVIVGDETCDPAMPLTVISRGDDAYVINGRQAIFRIEPGMHVGIAEIDQRKRRKLFALLRVTGVDYASRLVTFMVVGLSTDNGESFTALNNDVPAAGINMMEVAFAKANNANSTYPVFTKWYKSIRFDMDNYAKVLKSQPQYAVFSSLSDMYDHVEEVATEYMRTEGNMDSNNKHVEINIYTLISPNANGQSVDVFIFTLLCDASSRSVIKTLDASYANISSGKIYLIHMQSGKYDSIDGIYPPDHYSGCVGSTVEDILSKLKQDGINSTALKFLRCN